MRKWASSVFFARYNDRIIEPARMIADLVDNEEIQLAPLAEVFQHVPKVMVGAMGWVGRDFSISKS